MGRLEGKRVLVTGGGSGIGAAIVQRFVSEGAHVLVFERNEQTADEIRSWGADFISGDVAEADALERSARRLQDSEGGVDIAVANAGYELLGDALELSLEDWDAHQAVMLRGVYATFRAVLPAMIRQGAGTLVAVASQLSFVGLERFTSYLAAKAGVIGLVRGLAADFAGRGIRVNALCPGPTRTALIERQLVAVDDPRVALELLAGKTILKRLAEPEEIASAALFLASDEASYVTGSALLVDGGYTAV